MSSPVEWYLGRFFVFVLCGGGMCFKKFILDFCFKFSFLFFYLGRESLSQAVRLFFSLFLLKSWTIVLPVS